MFRRSFFTARQYLHLDIEEKCRVIVENITMESKDIRRCVLLNDAIEKGYIKVVQGFLEYHTDVNYVDENGFTPLHFAAQSGNEVITEMLINKGANINAKQKSGDTPLHIAVREDHIKVVETLLNSGAGFDTRGKGDLTPLHVAAKTDYLKIIEILLKFGADIDSRDALGRTALHIASERGNIEMVVLLLDYGSDVNLMCKDGYTPLDYAVLGYTFFQNLQKSTDNNVTNNYRMNHLMCSGLLSEHVIKMRALNLYVNEKNLARISNKQSSDFLYRCQEEIIEIKNEKAGNNFVFYDILTKDINQLARYARNEILMQVLEYTDYNITGFPLYSSLIKINLKKGQKRIGLVNPGLESFNCLTGYKLPEVFTREMFNYLSNTDLRYLTEACPDTDRE